MDIVIFEDITTESAICEIEKKAENYEGLYVDMEVPEERKFVKGMASEINGVLKKLDRARIDKSKKYKVAVENEALLIKARLEEANKPFTLLIDEHKELRAKQLAKEKELQAAKDLAFQLPIDHEEAFAMNELHDFKVAEEVRKQKEHDEEIADHARQEEVNRQEREKQAEAERISKAESDRENVGSVRKAIKEQLMDKCKIDEKTAKSVVLALLKIDQVTINY